MPVVPFCLRGAARAVQSCPPDVPVLRRASRMRRSRDFRETVTSGNRAGRPRLVVHVLESAEFTNSVPNVGFIVSSAVGGSVVRHRVTRQLRHIVWEQLSSLPPGTRVVVRALPAAACASSGELAGDIAKAFKRLGLVQGVSASG